jgi:hypothetical protein
MQLGLADLFHYRCESNSDIVIAHIYSRSIFITYSTLIVKQLVYLIYQKIDERDFTTVNVAIVFHTFSSVRNHMTTWHIILHVVSDSFLLNLNKGMNVIYVPNSFLFSYLCYIVIFSFNLL